MSTAKNVLEMSWDNVVNYLQYISEPKKTIPQNGIKNMKCESELMSHLLTNQQIT